MLQEVGSPCGGRSKRCGPNVSSTPARASRLVRGGRSASPGTPPSRHDRKPTSLPAWRANGGSSVQAIDMAAAGPRHPRRTPSARGSTLNLADGMLASSPCGVPRSSEPSCHGLTSSAPASSSSSRWSSVGEPDHRRRGRPGRRSRKLDVPVGSPLLVAERGPAPAGSRPVASRHVLAAHRTEFAVELPAATDVLGPAGCAWSSR